MPVHLFLSPTVYSKEDRDKERESGSNASDIPSAATSVLVAPLRRRLRSGFRRDELATTRFVATLLPSPRADSLSILLISPRGRSGKLACFFRQETWSRSIESYFREDDALLPRPIFLALLVGCRSSSSSRILRCTLASSG